MLVVNQHRFDVAGADAGGLHGDDLAVLVAVQDAGEPGANRSRTRSSASLMLRAGEYARTGCGVVAARSADGTSATGAARAPPTRASHTDDGAVRSIGGRRSRPAGCVRWQHRYTGMPAVHGGGSDCGDRWRMPRDGDQRAGVHLRNRGPRNLLDRDSSLDCEVAASLGCAVAARATSPCSGPARSEAGMAVG